MLIKITNFGPIKEFHFDLNKDFIVLFGKNNVGKSYSLSIVYLVLKNLLDMEADSIIQREISEDFNKLSEINSTNMGEIFYPIIENLTDNIEESLYNTYGEFDKLISRFRDDFKPIITIKKKYGELILEIQHDKLSIKEFSPILDRNVKEESTFFLYDEYIGKTKQDLSLIFLPASRTGLYQSLSNLSQIIVELSKNRRFVTKKFELLTISEPVSDYFLGLSNIQTKVSKSNNIILDIVNDIENNILKGKVEFDDVSKKIFYKPQNTDLKLDISLTSSMVSELSPIICYLKYVVAFSSSKTILFIEEPESHLHPEAQVQLMDIFAKLVKVGVKIIMTSHSDYMFNKMNNLILEKKIELNSSQAIIFKETQVGTIAKEIPQDLLGIDDENFLEITEQLFNEKMDLVEKYNNV
ncbi:MAG: AAA family ATPase [Thiomargarita sp.]|nr:AAA family ATPase [Thiomargarita sp.]